MNKGNLIDSKLISDVLKIQISESIKFNQLGLSNSNLPMSLSFFDDHRFLSQLNDNENISGVLVEENNSLKIIKGKIAIVVEDARWAYYTMYNFLSVNNKSQNKSVIDPSSIIHKTSFVSGTNVTIGKNCIIYPNVTILDDVVIGDNCIIQSGTVIGSEGFEYKKTSKGIIGVVHDGKVIIGNNVEIGANTCIDKGFLAKNTVIEDDAKIDNLVHVAHSVVIKRGAFVIACSMLAGSCIVGEGAWVGPNATVGHIELGNHANVTFGSVVTKNVANGEKVTGNFAIPHDKFIKQMKKLIALE